jgi:hypothetical protein
MLLAGPRLTAPYLEYTLARLEAEAAAHTKGTHAPP